MGCPINKTPKMSRSLVHMGPRAEKSKQSYFVKQTALGNAKILADFSYGEVSELADEHDLGSCAARRRGSSPLFPIEREEWLSANEKIENFGL